jgi:heat shock protein HslJ
MKPTLSILLLCCAIFFASCDETKKVIDAAGNVQLSGNYAVQSVKNLSAKQQDMTLTFTALDKSFSGQTGCNSVLGNYTLDLYALSFGELAVTEQYCEEDIMEAERAFLRALRETGSYGLENGILTLYSKNDRSALLTAKKQQRQ